jgi:hypothetical protein
MPQTTDFLRSLYSLDTVVKKSFRDRRPVSDRISRIDKALEEVLNRVQNSSKRDEINRLLQEIKTASAKGEATAALPAPSEFYAGGENRIQQLVPMKRKQVLGALAVADAVIKRQNDKKALNDSLPANLDELADMLTGLTKQTTDELQHAVAQPRKIKKQVKETSVWRFGLFIVGLILALGDVVLTLTPIGLLSVEIAKVSITAGAGCVTAAAKKTANK